MNIFKAVLFAAVSILFTSTLSAQQKNVDVNNDTRPSIRRESTTELTNVRGGDRKIDSSRDETKRQAEHISGSNLQTISTGKRENQREAVTSEGVLSNPNPTIRRDSVRRSDSVE